MAKIVTVYGTERRPPELVEMSYIRWFRMSEALARLGHQVDIATGELRLLLRRSPLRHAPGVRRVPLSRIRWEDYDVVKTLFHRGFVTLASSGGLGHPCVIAKLGSVVGPRDMPGIFFYGDRRERLYAIQEQIAEHSRFVTLLTEPARALWKECFGDASEILLVPGATEREIPDPGADPYPDSGAIRCVYAGNFYTPDPRSSQPAAHRSITDKLNRLGRHLSERGVRLYVVGPGDASALDDSAVDYLGTVSYDDSWDYLCHADVGIALLPGPFLHNNESTKLYHYLRVGLPIVTEEGFPNDDLVRRADLGFVVENGEMDGMATKIHEAARRDGWDRERAMRYVLDHHTWDQRALVYDEVLRRLLFTVPDPRDQGATAETSDDPPDPPNGPDGSSL